MKCFSILMGLSVAVSFAVDFMPDCGNIEADFNRAQAYFNAASNYPDGAFAMLKSIYQGCNNDPRTDPRAYGKVVYQLGKQLYHGKGVARNRDAGCYLFKEYLILHGDDRTDERIAWSMLYLGDCARNGFGETIDWGKAVKYYQKIISSPVAKDPNLIAWAQVRLADAYREGDGIEQNDQKAQELFTAIIEKDQEITDKSVVAWSKFWMADAYEHGKFVQKDLKKARELFENIAQAYMANDPIAVEHAQMRLQADHFKQQ